MTTIPPRTLCECEHADHFGANGGDGHHPDHHAYLEASAEVIATVPGNLGGETWQICFRCLDAHFTHITHTPGQSATVTETD